MAHVPGLLPEQLGDPAFRASHGVRFAYVVGEMANGIAGEELVEAAVRSGSLGFFGAAVCSYCSTHYVYDAALHGGAEPAECEYSLDAVA